MGSHDPVVLLDAIARDARALPGATNAWALLVSAAANATAVPPFATLLESARAGVTRDGAYVAALLPGSDGEPEGLLVVEANGADAAFEAQLGAIAALGGLRLENARLHGRIAAVFKARESLLASVSHDLRNPLNTFAMSVGLLRDDLERKDVDPARGLTLVSRMERASTRMQSMIEDLVEASRIDARKIEYAAKAESIAALLDAVARAAVPTGKDKAPAVIIEQASEAIRVTVDRARTLQLFAKVIAFLAKATGDSGSIHFTVNAGNDGVVISARGLGPNGMQLTKPEEGRAGLAQLLARGLAEGQNGAFRVDSTAGLVVHVTLPAAA